MKYATIGKNFYEGYHFEVAIFDNTEIQQQLSEHDCYKMLFLVSGSMFCKLNEQQILIIGPSAICLNEKDKMEIQDVSTLNILVLLFHPSVINDHFKFDTKDHFDKLSISEGQDFTYLSAFLDPIEPLEKIIPLVEMEANIMEHRLHSIKELIATQQKPSWPCRSRSFLYEILFSLSTQDMTESVHNPVLCSYSELTVEIMRYLHACYNQKITIESLCKRFSVNRTTLMDEFKNNMGKSIHQYLMQLRISMAMKLLRGTKLPIDIISENCGFSDIGYFSKSFKKQLQMTPIQYRERNL